MALLEFKQEYRCGIESIDYEHEKLIDLINGLHRTLVGDKDRKKIDYVLGELHSQIAAHFALEEKEMRDMNYPDVDAHSVDHHRLLDEIHEIGNRFAKDGAYQFLPALEAEVLHWFTHHFRTVDSKLHAALKDRKT